MKTSLYIALAAVSIFAGCVTRAPPAQVRKDPLELSLDTGTCRLTERGWAAKSDPLTANGKREQSECSVGISDAKLGGHAVCVLSGLSVSSAPNASYYGCRVSREIEGFLFRANLEPKDIGASAIVCSFLCYSP